MRALDRLSAQPRRQRGFSLIEMLVALFILSVVLAIVTDGIVQMQNRNNAITQKTDSIQMTRDYIDQMVRDIHNAGYPPSNIFSGSPDCIASAVATNVACGILSFQPNQVIYEADLDGTGTVYRIWLNLVPGPGGTCPCTLQRGVLPKVNAMAPGAVYTFYTEVSGVLNSGNGAGGSLYGVTLPGPGNYASYTTADAFAAYDVNGAQFVNPLGLISCNTVAPYTNWGDCSSIRSIRVTANVTTTVADPQSKIYPVVTIISRARRNN